MGQAMDELEMNSREAAFEMEEVERAIEEANLRRQDDEGEMEVLQPRHDLLQQEFQNVQTLLADLKLKEHAAGDQTARADATEEQMAELLRSVVHLDTPQLLDKERAITKK